MALSRRANVVPAPINVFPAQSFMGDDGQWSTFTVQVGTPPQGFHILPSTEVSETWVPLPDGCTSTDPSNCQTQRGGETFNGQAAQGFLTNQSSTWDEIGLYGIDTETSLGINANGLFGTDTVAINGGNGSTGGISLAKQTVGGIATKDYFLGYLGLSVSPSSFSSAATPLNTFLQNLFNEDLIPSLSFGYTAGASYGQNGQNNWGSLVLGGYDSTKFDNSTGISVPFASQDTRILTVGVQSIIGTNVNNGTASMTTTGGHLSLIDSTVSQLWLPSDVCEEFAGNLNLTYDSNTGLYLLDSTAHTNLQNANPSFTFKIGQTAYDNGQSVSIVFPYSAFDLSIGWPAYNETVNYFPIRRAANSSQYTLGRAFLQEAYIIVDYEKKNFTVAPAKFPDTTITPHLVGITSSGSSSGGSHSGLSTGAIVGIAIGGIFAVALVIAALFFFCRKPRKARKAEISELDAKDSTIDPHYSKISGIHEADGDQVNELPASYENYNKATVSELDNSTQVYEMEGEGSLYAPGSTPALGRSTPHTNTSGRRSTPFSPVSDQYSPAQPSPMSRGEMSPEPPSALHSDVS